MTPDEILENADRLIADARLLYEAGRTRSAATLIVVAIEQMAV
jgi:AbiV family abortive infection protein